MINETASYTGCTCTNLQDTRITIEKLDDVTLSITEKRHGIDEDISNILIGKDLDAYVHKKQLY